MRLVTAVLSASLLLATAIPASAHPTRALDPTLPTDVTFDATDNVEYLGRFPEHTGTAGGRLVGDVFFLTDPRGVHAYDVSDPADPELLGSLPLPQRSTGVALAQEDVDTDGRILLVDAVDPRTPAVKADLNSGTLQVVDVRDPAAMTVIGTADVADHTWTCVSARTPGPRGRSAQARGGAARVAPPGARAPQGPPDVNRCAYAYGRSGHIVDLTDPTQPQVLEGTWREAVGYGGRGNSPYTHDLTEIRPGLVMSAGSTNILMDTSDPTQPVELTRVAQQQDGSDRFPSLGYHSVEWANDGEDRIAVFGTEIAPAGPTNLAGSDCEGDNSVIETWDAGAIAEALDRYEDGDLTAEEFRRLRFSKLDAFDAGGRGIFVDGQAPGHVLYCAHWMELHPDFDGGGLMVVSYYDRGTRFVDVAADGTMQEIGWITPAEGYSGSAQWISDDVVYIMDYRRGLEVVRLLDAPATGVYSNGGIDVIAAGSSIQPLAADEGPPWPASVAIGIALALVAGEVQRRWRPSSARA